MLSGVALIICCFGVLRSKTATLERRGRESLQWHIISKLRCSMELQLPWTMTMRIFVLKASLDRCLCQRAVGKKTPQIIKILWFSQLRIKVSDRAQQASRVEKLNYFILLLLFSFIFQIYFPSLPFLLLPCCRTPPSLVSSFLTSPIQIQPCLAMTFLISCLRGIPGSLLIK